MKKDTRIETELKELESSKTLHLEIAKNMMEAYNSSLYPLDLLAVAVFKRSLSLIRGFSDSIRNKNFICAAPLVRLQLDNLLRFYACFIVTNPHDFAVQILDGKHVRNLRDMENKKMTDRHLVEKLSKEFPWIKPVYEETSGYIHLSNKHIFNTMNSKVEDEKRVFTVIVGDEDSEFVKDSLILEAIQAMKEITKVLLKHLHGWAYTKDNPDKIDQARKNNSH
jgi:hypothetical protein